MLALFSQQRPACSNTNLHVQLFADQQSHSYVGCKQRCLAVALTTTALPAA